MLKEPQKRPNAYHAWADRGLEELLAFIIEEPQAIWNSRGHKSQRLGRMTRQDIDGAPCVSEIAFPSYQGMLRLEPSEVLVSEHSASLHAANIICTRGELQAEHLSCQNCEKSHKDGAWAAISKLYFLMLV